MMASQYYVLRHAQQTCAVGSPVGQVLHLVPDMLREPAAKPAHCEYSH